MNTMSLEEDTRALINNTLENLGWNWNGINQNVYFERTKTKEEQQKLKGKRPDYVLYPKKGNKPLIVIEAKRKGARIDYALEQGINYARAIGAPLVFATDGVFCKSYHTIDNCTPILNGEELDEFIREALALKFLNKHEVNTVSPKVQYDRKELIKIFDETNNLLRGEGLRAGIDRFGEFANILFLKLISETEQIKIESGEKTRFDSYCHWNAIKEIPPQVRIEYINNTVYKRLNALYNTEIFTPLNIRNENILSEIMDKLDPLVLTDVDSDVKGDAFEYFLRASTATKNDLGEYFTPRHIVKTMVRLINPQIGEKIYDPFCGTGGFLIESFRYIYNNMARTEFNIDTLKNRTVYGNEITNTARITKMNMILAGDGHSNIKMQDSLANPVDGNIQNNGFDAVITNMPYSQKTQYGTLYDIPSKNGDSICVQHCMKAINSVSENGRMALVVPEGFLFRKDLSKTREYLLEHCQLQSIISLPQGVFLPYTGVKTDIIYATKVNRKIKSSDKKTDIWYFDVKSDGYTLDNHRRKLDAPSDLSKYEEYRRLDIEQANEMLKVGFDIIPIQKVYENSFVLVGGRYKNIETKKSKYPMIKLGDKNYFEVYSGGTPSSANTEYWNGGINWVTLADIPANEFVAEIKSTERKISELGLSNSNARLLPVNTVVVSSRATIGRIGIARTELATNQGFKNIVVKDTNKILPEYLAYALTAKVNDIIQLASGATFKEISKENFCTIQIPMLPIKYQRDMVSEINEYRDIIVSAQNIKKKYIPKVSISKKCKNVAISEIFVFISDSTNPKEGKGIVNYIGLENIESNTGKIVGNIKCDIQTIKSTKRIFKKGDILFGKLRPALNKVAIADCDGICSTDILVLRAKNEDIIPEFYSILLRNKEFNLMVLNGVTGGQLPRVDKDYLFSLEVPKVSYKKQIEEMKNIAKEKELMQAQEQIIDLFSKKIEKRVKEIWEE